MKKKKSGQRLKNTWMRVPKILVTGDSWSAGEWDTSIKGYDINYHAREHSISEYLSNMGKYHVIHYPWPGHGDTLILHHLFERHDLADIDYIVYVKTCATRSFNYLDLDQHSTWFEEENILTKITWMNDSTYIGLRQIKDKLILLGGIEKIRSSFECFYKLPSITEYFYPEFQDTEYFGDIKYIKDMLDKDKWGGKFLLESAERKIQFWKKHPEIFYPDGAHPNRTAHKELANLIDKQLSQF